MGTAARDEGEREAPVGTGAAAARQGGSGGWARMSAAALTAAVVGGLLGGTPTAHAAPPPDPGGPAAGDPDDDSARGELPPVWPRPQSMRAKGAFVPAGSDVVLVADKDADRYALDTVREVLRDAGVRTLHETEPGSRLPGDPDDREGGKGGKGGTGRDDGKAPKAPKKGAREDDRKDARKDAHTDGRDDREDAQGGGKADRAGARQDRSAPPSDALVVRVGDKAAEGALRALKAPDRGDLPKGGYRLAAGSHGGRDTVALDGADAAGLFHAAQTLRQLATERGGAKGFPGVTVRDWPTSAVRGTTEGFYGQPWSHEQRLAQLDFLGRTKQNRYLYAPGDDPYRQAARWRDPYPAAERAAFRQLAERAKRNHVVLGWAVSPGQGLCFSSDDDRRALLRKVDSMWALGVRAFQLRFEDVSYSEWHCGADSDTYGSGPEAAARAQAELANDVAAHLKERHPEAEPLSVMPTEFYQKGATKYRTALADELNDRVQIGWSGVGVVPRAIKGGELARVGAAFPRHRMVTMDNYPVNDYAQDRIFLGPYQGREPAVAAGSAALLTNAMEQPTASRIPLFTAADYAWNPRGYNAEESWKAAIDEVAGGRDADPATRAAVHALAANDASSVLAGEESGYLKPLLSDFWKAYDGGAGPHLQEAATRLRTAFRTMRTAPDRVPAALRTEVRPWLAELARLGEAGERSVDLLLAHSRGDGAAAWQAQLDVRKLREASDKAEATVGKRVLTGFADKALKLNDEWTGVREPGEKSKGSKASKGSKGSKDSKGAGDGKAPEDTPKGSEGDQGSKTDGDAPGGGTSAGKGGKGDRPGPSAVRGGPDAVPGSPLSAVVDGDPKTAYRAAGSPSAGSLLPPSPPMLVPPSRAGAEHAGADDREALTVALPKTRPLRAVTVLTGPDSGTKGRVEAHVPGKGWQRLGLLSQGGWTQLTGHKDRTDALRVVWAEDSAPPVVHEITPWYADAPGTALELPDSTVDAAVGGEPATAHARVTGHRPADTRGRVTAKAPKGFTVRTPLRTMVRRGATVDVPLRITADSTVKPGSYRIPVSYGDERATLTVRAYPRTAGPDLARKGEAKASANETDDFPASAVTDGRKSTRWSSPAEDGQWVQVKLAERARVGKVVLRWQDAYASRYRVQVSPDGKRWRTAATVRKGEGGREQVRMDAPRDTRYVRIQTDERGTRFGVSLYGVEIYAVEAKRGAHAKPRQR